MPHDPLEIPYANQYRALADGSAENQEMNVQLADARDGDDEHVKRNIEVRAAAHEHAENNQGDDNAIDWAAKDLADNIRPNRREFDGGQDRREFDRDGLLADQDVPANGDHNQQKIEQMQGNKYQLSFITLLYSWT